MAIDLVLKENGKIGRTHKPILVQPTPKFLIVMTSSNVHLELTS